MFQAASRMARSAHGALLPGFLASLLSSNGAEGFEPAASDASYGKKQAAGLALRQDATGHPSGSLPQ